MVAGAALGLGMPVVRRRPFVGLSPFVTPGRAVDDEDVNPITYPLEHVDERMPSVSPFHGSVSHWVNALQHQCRFVGLETIARRPICGQVRKTCIALASFLDVSTSNWFETRLYGTVADFPPEVVEHTQLITVQVRDPEFA